LLEPSAMQTDVLRGSLRHYWTWNATCNTDIRDVTWPLSPIWVDHAAHCRGVQLL